MNSKTYLIPVLNDNYIFIFHCLKTNIVACIDPALSQPVIDFLEEKKLKLDYILNTHHHGDHIGGNLELKKYYNCKIMGYRNDQKRIAGIDILLNDNQKIKIGEISFKVIFTPGHTLGHICYFSESEKIIFVGDTLFSSGCGRLFEGTPQEMYNSLEKIKNLPLNTKIYCAHEYTKSNLEFALKLEPKNLSIKNKLANLTIPSIPTNLKLELETNPFLRTLNLNLRKNAGKTSDSYNEEVFAKIRKMKDNF